MGAVNAATAVHVVSIQALQLQGAVESVLHLLCDMSLHIPFRG